MQQSQGTIERMPRPRKPDTDRKPRNTERHVSPRVAFHLPQAYLDCLDKLRGFVKDSPRPAKKTLTAEILEALEAHFDRNKSQLAGLWPPTEVKD